MNLLSKQRGLMLIVLLFLVGTVGIGAIVYSINSTAVRTERDKRTTQALEKAKAAIIAWSLTRTTPGMLPCPEDTAKIGLDTEGEASSSCSNTQPTIGRLAWKTLGLGDLRDGNGDRLWYVLSPRFRSAPINSDTLPQVTADGAPTVAIVFSPGDPLSNQSRPVPTSSSPPDITQYLESPNNISNQTVFVSTPQSATLNDRLLTIRAGDLMPALEKRALDAAKTALTTYYQSYAFYPFAASAGSSSNPNQCVAGNLQGLLPTETSYASCTCTSSSSNRVCACDWSNVSSVSYTRTGTSNYFGTTGTSAPTAPCQVRSTVLANDTCYCTGGGGDCKRSGTTRFSCSSSGNCTFSSTSTGYFTLTGSQTLSLPTPNLPSNKCSVSANVVTCTFTGSGQTGEFEAGSCTDPNLADNPATFNLPSWFADNNWQDHIYYIVSSNCTSTGANCTTATPQLTVGSTSGIRALLIAPGSRITATPYAISKGAAQQARPSTNIADYLDSTENTNGDTIFDAVNMHRTSNYNDQMTIVAP